MLDLAVCRRRECRALVIQVGMGDSALKGAVCSRGRQRLGQVWVPSEMRILPMEAAVAAAAADEEEVEQHKDHTEEEGGGHRDAGNEVGVRFRGGWSGQGGERGGITRCSGSAGAGADGGGCSRSGGRRSVGVGGIEGGRDER